MAKPHMGRTWRWRLIALAWLGVGTQGSLWAQDAPAPAQEALEEALPATPSLPNPSAPGVGGDEVPMTPREAALEARIRQLESMVEQLSGQMQTVTSGAGAGAPPAAGEIEAQTTPGAPGAAGSAPGTAPLDVGVPATTAEPSATGGVAAPGQSLPPNPPPNARFDIPATLESKKSNVKFGPGFEIRSDDDEFILQFHNLTQFDYRGYLQSAQAPVHNSFSFPRQWFMFGGRLTKPLGYFVSIANGFDTIGILDAFLDLEYDPRLRLRVGRFKTPFTYEFLVEPVQGLIVPERSLFFNNFGLNRDNGIMAYGRLANNTFDYAVGIFNGSRNGLLNRNNSQDVAAFINWKPFNNNQGSLLENFNIGGSVFAGNENNLPVPQTLRTAVATSGNAIIGVPFLTFNHNVRESGDRAFWDLHTAWFYRQLAVVAEWGSGFQDYALSSDMASRTHLPVQSWYVQAGYFLTGETRSGFGIVKPKSPFDIRKGQFGTGAIEPFLRYDMLNLGGQVFTNGLADPNSWTNNLYMTDVGVNWHLTQYLKIYFDWQHAVFGNPVVYAPSRLQKTSNMFMVRFQVYF